MTSLVGSHLTACFEDKIYYVLDIKNNTTYGYSIIVTCTTNYELRKEINWLLKLFKAHKFEGKETQPNELTYKYQHIPRPAYFRRPRHLPTLYYDY